MKVSIEFYRTRDRDDAHALLGRVTREARDTNDAVTIARALLATLEMPQWPDAMTISDVWGRELCRRAVCHRNEHGPMPGGDLFADMENDAHE
jgi:hypothetical protein